MSRYASMALTVEDILLGADLKHEKKRHATFFPSKLDLTGNFRRQAEEEEDDYSTWEFHAPVSPRRPKFTANAVMSAAQKISTSMSAAQQVAYQYRAGLKINVDNEWTPPSSRSTSSSTGPSTLVGSEGSSWISSWKDAVMESQWSNPVEEPRLRHTESRAGALAAAEKEALREIKFGHRAIVCPRKECRETLSDVRALACHLSLHDIEKSKPYYCQDCDRGFNKRQALNAHACPSRSRSAPSSPIFATFQHVLTKITSRD